MPISNEQFLICCIENTNGGVVDWQKVADATETTKGAASIKFRRMKEKFGTISAADKTPGADGEATPKAKSGKATPKSAAGSKKKGGSKKRKLGEGTADEDDEEGKEGSPVKGEDGEDA